MYKFMKIIGGKRGLAVVLGIVIGTLTAFGVITPHQAEIAGGIASLVGLGGIAHSNIKANALAE